MFIKEGHMEVEELFHQVEEEIKTIDHYLYQEACIEHIEQAIEYLESLKNTITNNL